MSQWLCQALFCSFLSFRWFVSVSLRDSLVIIARQILCVNYFFQFFHLFLNFISFLLHIVLSIQKTARFKNKTCGLPDYYEILIPVLFSSICVNGLFSTKISIMLPGLTIWEYCVFNPTTGIKEIKKHTNIITRDPFANPRMPPAALLMNPIPGRLLI